MAIILDADVIIRAEKKIFDLERWIASCIAEDFEIAAITIAELWHDVERATGANRTNRVQFLQKILGRLAVINYTEQTAYEHARIWADLAKGGKMIGDYDLIVAATALERGSTLATFNKRHFSFVTGLKIVEPKLLTES